VNQQNGRLGDIAPGRTHDPLSSEILSFRDKKFVNLYDIMGNTLRKEWM